MPNETETASDIGWIRRKMLTLKPFLLNKIYGRTIRSAVIKRAPAKLKHYHEMLDGLYGRRHLKEYFLEFKDGFKLKCGQGDLGAVAETCVLEDYQRKPVMTITAGDVVFDIGAHIGSFSLYAAARGARVFAFEPEEANYNRLVENIRLNNWNDRITPLRTGIYTYDGVASLATDASNPAGHSIKVKSDGAISVCKLSTIFARLNLASVDLMKIDVEGSEYAIFDSPDIRSLNIRRIVGEYHLDWKKPNIGYKTICRLLRPHFIVGKYPPYYFWATAQNSL